MCWYVVLGLSIITYYYYITHCTEKQILNGNSYTGSMPVDKVQTTTLHYMTSYHTFFFYFTKCLHHLRSSTWVPGCWSAGGLFNQNDFKVGQIV